MEDATKKRVLIIDNGTYECRAGWSDENAPGLKFRNVLTKPRKDRKKEKDSKDKEQNAENASNLDSVIQVGNDITNIEAVRAQLKSAFDRNVITNWNHQEQILDYIFSNMGFEGQSSIDNPIVMTEAPANPNYCRLQMSELLFELYGVPALSYGIDALFSWQHYEQEKKQPQQDALIVAFGFSATHVIPILNGVAQLQRVRRLNVGGYHVITFLFRLMQMKYPVHINAITVSRIETLVQQNCFIAVDYQQELAKWASLDYYDANVLKIQLPYNAVTVANAMMTAEQKQERRRELAYRLIEMKNRREREKQQDDEKQLTVFYNIRQLYEQQKLQKFERALQQQQIANLAELDKQIETVRLRVERYKQRMLNPQTKPKPQPQDKIAKPPAGITQELWLNGLRDKREEILKRKEARKAQRQEQAKRHTHAAQERMRIISTLARNEKRNEDDNFGMNDDDWDVYKRINRYDDSDSDTDNEKLLEYQKILSHYDVNEDDEAVTQAVSEAAAAEDYQLHFGVETIRGAEIFFQPSMIGCPEMGIAELIAYVLKLFTPEEQQRMVDHVFLTGGCAQFNGLKERLHKELMERRPFQSTFAIYETSEHLLSAYMGACQYARSADFVKTLTTRAEYDEFGGEYFKTHKASNLYYPTPKD